MDVTQPAPRHTGYHLGADFYCDNCGQRYMPGYPLPIGAYRVLAQWWGRTHAYCPRPNKINEQPKEVTP